MSKLTIKQVYRKGNQLICNYVLDGDVHGLYAKVEDEYSSFLTEDRADGFFVICAYKCIKEGWDLESEVPVSTRLLYQVQHYMKNVYSETFEQKQSNIKAPFIDKVLPSAGGVGTGITCGVDSLYTIATHCNIDNMQCLPLYNITHLVLLNVGSHDIGVEDAESLYSNRIELGRSFCKEYGFNFVNIDTNFKDFLSYDYTEYHGIVNGSTILLLQKLFKIYYSSSSYKISEFKLNRYDVSQFELFNLAVLSTDNTIFYTTGGDISRYEKVRLLSKWKPSYNYLNVCNAHNYNCSRVDCVKCCRTIIELDVLNALDNYNNVFDIDKYEKNKYEYLAELYARKVLRHDHYAIELWDDLKKKYNIPFNYKLKAIVRFIRKRLKIYSFKQIRTLIKLSK